MGTKLKASRMMVPEASDNVFRNRYKQNYKSNDLKVKYILEHCPVFSWIGTDVP